MLIPKLQLGTGEHIIAPSKGNRVHGEDTAAELAEKAGTRVEKRVPVGVNERVPKPDDHIAELCKVCKEKHGPDSDHPFEFAKGRELESLNKALGKPNDLPKGVFRAGTKSTESDSGFKSKIVVGEPSEIAKSVQNTPRVAARKAKDKLEAVLRDEE